MYRMKAYSESSSLPSKEEVAKKEIDEKKRVIESKVIPSPKASPKKRTVDIKYCGWNKLDAELTTCIFSYLSAQELYDVHHCNRFFKQVLKKRFPLQITLPLLLGLNRVRVNQKEFVSRALQLAEQNIKGARGWLAFCYMNGLGVPRNTNEAKKHASLGESHWLAQYVNLRTAKSPEGGQSLKVLQSCKEAVAKNEVHSLTILGKCYEDVGIEKNPEEGIRLYKMEADQGNVLSQCELGWCYQQGSGVEIDSKQANTLFSAAAAQGYAVAYTHLGVNHYFGRGLAKDAETAVRYFQKAIHYGEVDALYNLAICYRFGVGIEKNIDNAKMYYKLAALQEHENAAEALRNMNAPLE